VEAGTSAIHFVGAPVSAATPKIMAEPQAVAILDRLGRAGKGNFLPEIVVIF